MSWFTMAGPLKKRNLSSPRSNPRAARQMQFRRTWEFRTELRCWRNRCVQSSATDWTCWCSTPESARRRASKTIRSRILTVCLRQTFVGRSFWCSKCCQFLEMTQTSFVISSAVARTVVGKPGLDNPSILAYAATKGALETLVKNWAAILGPRGIRVNAVAPGVIDTDMSNFTKTEAGRELTVGMQALKRIGKPEDVADVVVFLASNKARWITGASIPVDGGSKL
jgi:NAD(P)-dependent dehydrogenase (short-subunit alcohol dehydrogenase family)